MTIWSVLELPKVERELERLTNLNNSMACKFSYILDAFFFLFHTIPGKVSKKSIEK